MGSYVDDQIKWCAGVLGRAVMGVEEVGLQELRSDWWTEL